MIAVSLKSLTICQLIIVKVNIMELVAELVNVAASERRIAIFDK